MVIGSMPGVELVSVAPLALALLKLTVPKFASGRTPPLLEGASAITSADARAACLSLAVTVLLHAVPSEIVRGKLPEPLVVTDAVIFSPACTGLLKVLRDFGYISY